MEKSAAYSADSPSDVVTSYVSRLVATRPRTAAPTADIIPAAVLFADISGFTAVTEALAEQGPVGAETLSRILNDYFGQLIDTILDFGGDILKFAGDALIAIWPTAGSSAVAGDLVTATHAAVGCALAVQETLRDYQTADARHLVLRLTIGAGSLYLAQLGGVYNRWELLIDGDPLQQALEGSRAAAAGEVYVSAEAWQLVAGAAVGQTTTAGMHVTGLRVPAPQMRPPVIPRTADVLRRLQAYLPGAIRPRLAAGQGGWLAELRRVTVLFIHLPGLTHDTPLTEAQQVVKALQTAVYRYEGSVNKLTVDEKGIMLVAVLGLPPLAHEDDPVRGTQVALAAQDVLRTAGLPYAIGVTTGRVFCGTVGNARRREYTVIGDAVNLAARMMQAAGRTTYPAVLCDDATMQAAQHRIQFVPLAPTMVKGKTAPLGVHQPMGQKRNFLLAQPDQQAPLVGRTQERMRFVEAVQRLLRGESEPIIVEGEAGIGKTRMLVDWRAQAERVNVRVLVGGADAVEKLTPYHGWRPIFMEIFANREGITVEEQLPEKWRPYAPLLNAVLPRQMSENETTRTLVGEGRASRTADLLLTVLRHQSEKRPLIVMLEDAHWLDSASWRLAAAVVRTLTHALLIASMRRWTNEAPSGYLEVQSQAEMVRLDSLPPDAVEQLVAQQLGVAELPGKLIDFIHRKSQGHPFYSEELAYALRDAGHISVVGGRCTVSEAVDLDEISSPDTVQGVVISRIDRLTPPQQLTLKVAGVIGQSFSINMLQAVHPIEADKPDLGTHLNALTAVDIVVAESEESGTYMFKHAIIRDVAYGLLLYAQRRQLHRAAAEWMEERFAVDLSPHYDVLAYHWQQAQKGHRAAKYLGLAAEQALRGGVYRAAVEYLERLRPLAEGAPVVEHARWLRLLGEAHDGLGEVSDSLDAFRQALVLLGYPLPMRQRGLIAGTVGRMMRAVSRYLIGRSPLKKAAAEARSGALYEAALIYDRLSEFFYTRNNGVPSLYTATRSLQMAEAVGRPSLLATAYGSMHGLFRVMNWHSAANRYAAAADTYAAQSENDVIRIHKFMRIVTLALGHVPWSELISEAEAMLTLSRKLGVRRQEGVVSALLGMTHYYSGGYRAGAALCRRLRRLGQVSRNAEHEAWGVMGEGHHRRLLGEHDTAEALLTQALERFRLISDESMQAQILYTQGGLMQLYWAQGRHAEAEALADDSWTTIQGALPLTHFLRDAHLGAAMVYGLRWRAVGGRFYRRRSWWACWGLYRFSWLHYVARPDTWLWWGHWAHTAGWATSAVWCWRRSLHWAEKLDMPLEEGKARYALAAHGLSGPEAVREAGRAEEIFADLEAADRRERAANLAQRLQAVEDVW